MSPVHANAIPPASRLEKEEPEIAEEDDIPADDQTAEGNRWARGEGACDGAEPA